MKKVLLKIEGMTCSACSSGLEKYLNKQEGIKTASVNLIMNNASIEYDETEINLEQVEKYIEKAGFSSLGIDKLENEEKKKTKEKSKLIGISIISILILYISMAHMVKLPVISYLDMMHNPVNYAIALLILTTIVLIIGKDILKNGYKNLVHKTPNMDTLVAIGVLASYIYSIYGTIKIIKGQVICVENLYYESAAIVIFFIKIGKYVENKNKDKTKEALKQLMSITPNHAIIEKEGKEETVTLDEIQKGDIIICKPGEKIAVDGEVIEGTTHINESFITGESVPVKREKGSKVIAGSINYEGTIKYKAEKIGKESTVSEIVRLVVEATNTKAKIADKISGYFVPTIIIIAIISFAIWLAISKNLATAINIFVTILVVACPCSLGLATPLAIVISSGKASKKGILVKTSEALENAHKIKTICFDKTGTLTKGELTISKIYNYSNLEEKEIIKKVASIENKSEHPIARAIVEKAKEEKIELDQINNFKAIAGYGVRAEIKEQEKSHNYLIGNKKLMKENNIQILKEDDETELVTEGNSILYIAQDQKIIALIGVKDTIKEESKEIIEKLKKRKIEVIMLTGDNEKTAKAIAKQLGIEKVIANVLPKQKAEEIKKLKQNGLVMMCGDGINDSVSLVTADIGVSISSGTDIAMDSAEVVLMNDNLEKIEELIEISRKTIRNIKQNLFWAFFYNTCMVPIACGILEPLGITMNPMIAAFAMTISSLTVVLNALRLR